MRPQERLKLVHQIQDVKEDQSEIDKKIVILSKEMEEDTNNVELTEQIKKLKNEFDDLQRKSEELICRL